MAGDWDSAGRARESETLGCGAGEAQRAEGALPTSRSARTALGKGDRLRTSVGGESQVQGGPEGSRCPQGSAGEGEEMKSRWCLAASLLAALASFHCGGKAVTSGDAGTSGGGGSAGTAGSSGAGGTSGAGGSSGLGGSSGTGGSAGSSGAGGSLGSGGTSGSPGDASTDAGHDAAPMMI